MNCPICNSDKSSFLYHLYDDRYGYHGLFSLLRCGACTHVYLDCDLSPADIQRLYTEFYPRSEYDVKDYRPHKEIGVFRAWLDGACGSAFRWVSGGVKVLDIGCGFGETLGYHQARGCEVQGVEADENIRRVAEHYGFNVKVGLFDGNNYPEEYFDYVTMDQVLEHVKDPVPVMHDVARVIKSEGVLVLSFPNASGWGQRIFGRRWINWHVPYHMQFYSRQSIAMLAAEAGFTVKTIRTVTSSAWLRMQWAHLLLYPEHGVPSEFWGKVSERSLYSSIICKMAGFLHMIKVNHLLSRLFDACGLGDNFIVVLKKK